MKKIFKVFPALSKNDLDNYLNGTSNEQERFRTENQLIDSPLHLEAVEGYQEAGLTPGKVVVPAFDSFLASLPQETHEHKAVMRKLPLSRRIPRWSVAAAILLLVTVTAGYWMNTANSNNRLFSDHYQAYDNDLMIELRGGNDEANTMAVSDGFQAALRAYDAKDFRQSLTQLEEVLRQEPTNGNAAFYAGVAALELDRNEEALAYLNTARSSSKFYQQDALWYSALANLKLGDKDQAKSLLDQLLRTKNSFYSEKAQKLTSKL